MCTACSLSNIKVTTVENVQQLLHKPWMNFQCWCTRYLLQLIHFQNSLYFYTASMANVVSPTAQHPYPSPTPPGTIIPTAFHPQQHRHPHGTTMIPHPHHPSAHPMYYFPSPPVSPTGQVYYPTAAATNSAIIRLRGLQYGATQQDVANFFQGYGVGTF